jgi:hypothetical protein
MLSKAEVRYLQGQKQVSKSYEYELKSILKKKIISLVDNDLPLLANLFPNLDITKFGKKINDSFDVNLTINGKKRDKLQEQRKSKACESIEGSKTYPTANIDKKEVKNDNASVVEIKRGSAGRGI